MSRFEQLLARMASHRSSPCIVEGSSQISYEDLLRQIQLRLPDLAARGVQPGTVVALHADYSARAIALLFAIVARGAVVALIPRAGRSQEYVADCRATWLAELAADEETWSQTATAGAHPLLEALARRGEGGFVIFTSGSSGRPKAALQSVERFLHKFEKPGRGLRTLAFLLFDHVAGLDTTFYTLSNGGTLVLTPKRDPQSILQLIETQRVEVLPASPSFLRMLCLVHGESRRDLSSLKVVTYGSEPMDLATLARLNELFPSLQISQKYGATELGSPRTRSKGNDSLWISFDPREVQTRVVDGELHVRSPGALLGYLNAPSPVDADGWYATGDLVDVDGEWLRFRGRASDVIKVGGEKVTPAEVEHVILQLGFVREAAVFGEAHALMGQIIVARVVLDTALTEDAALKEIRRHCRASLAPHQVPVRIEIESGSLVTARQKNVRRPAEEP